MNLLRLKMETISLPEWLVAVSVEVALAVPLQFRQVSLFSDDAPQDAHHLRQLIDRLKARLGEQAVNQPMLLSEVLPENVVTMQSPDDMSTDVCSGEPGPAIRPLELLAGSQPIDVQLDSTSELPTIFFWNRKRYRVVHCSRPEYISTDWWNQAGMVRRCYYRVTTQCGDCFWIYHDSAGQWFMHGLFG